MSPRIAAGAALAAAILGWSDPAAACACCADTGTRHEIKLEAAGHVRQVLRAVRLGNAAHVFTTPCGMECVEGIVKPVDSYRAAMSRRGGRWQIELTDPASGRTGALSFTMPKQITSFAVDTDPKPGRPGTMLYKELRIVAPISGNGVFAAAGRNPAWGAMVLQGRGNRCRDPAQFTHWSLDVTGVRVRFRLFGKLGPPKP